MPRIQPTSLLNETPYLRKERDLAYTRDLKIKWVAAAISLVILWTLHELDYFFAIPLAEVYVRSKPLLIFTCELTFFYLLLKGTEALPLLSPFLEVYTLISSISWLSFFLYVALKVVEKRLFGRKCYNLTIKE